MHSASRSPLLMGDLAERASCWARPDAYGDGSFGETPEVATELAELVIAGTKRATASLTLDYGEGRGPGPKPGDFAR